MPLLAGAAAVTAMGIPAEGGADARRNMVALGLVLAFLVLVKSAAALFAVAALAVAAMRARPRRGVLVAAAFPVVATILWSAHCSYVFPAAETSKHAVSATGWMETLSGKSPGDLAEIVSSMAGFAVSPLSLVVPLAGLVLAFVLAVAVDRHVVARGEDAGLDSPRPRLSDPARAVVFAVVFYVISRAAGAGKSSKFLSRRCMIRKSATPRTSDPSRTPSGLRASSHASSSGTPCRRSHPASSTSRCSPCCRPSCQAFLESRG